jgi:hypothetical protein
LKPEIVLSDAAVSDILEQAAWYQEKSGAKLASRWEGAVTSILLKMQKILQPVLHAILRRLSLKVCDAWLCLVSPGTLCFIVLVEASF